MLTALILFIVYMSIGMTYFALREDGFKFIVYDRDKDGVVQENTKYQRSFFYWNRHPSKKLPFTNRAFSFFKRSF